MGLVTIRSPSGASFTVDESHAPKFQGFVNDLEAGGYKINSKESGGYNPRTIAGTNKISNHAHGAAIDINWGTNARGVQGDLPQNVNDIAQKHGLSWGGTWKNRDDMHFEVAGANAHSHDTPAQIKPIAAALTGSGPSPMIASPMISATYDPNEMTPEAVALQRKIALGLLGQGSDISPVGHPLAALARAIQGGVGGLQRDTANDAEKATAAREASFIQSLANPQAAPRASASTAPSVTLPAAVPAARTSPQQMTPMDALAASQPASRTSGEETAGQPLPGLTAQAPAALGTAPPLPAPMGPNGQRLPLPSEMRPAINPQDASPRSQRMTEEQYQAWRANTISQPWYLRMAPEKRKVVDELIAQRAPLAPKLQTVEGDVVDISDPNNVKVIYRNNKPTSEQQNYESYAKQERSQGREPMSELDYAVKLKQAGVAQPENTRLVKSAEALVDIDKENVKAGNVARGFIGNMDILREHSRAIGNEGAMANIKQRLGPLATYAGIPVDKLDSIQAFQSIIEKVAPTMRAPGSGATSDIEYQGFLKSLPQLSATAQGREMILNQLSAISRDAVQRGQISKQVLMNKITPEQADKMLESLPDVMSIYRQYEATQPKQPAVGAKPVKVNSPEEAEQLPPGTRFITPDGRPKVR